MPNILKFCEYQEIQEKSTREQSNYVRTLSVTPQNSKLFSIKNFFEDDSEEPNKTIDPDELILNEDHKYTPYKSFTDIMANRIKALADSQQQIQDSEVQKLSNLIKSYQSIMDEYFQSVFSLNFSPNYLSLIFNPQSMTFGSSKALKTLETTELISTLGKNVIKKQISKHKNVQKLLQITGRQLFQELNFEFLYIANLILKNTEKLSHQQIVQEIFYDSKIKYINFKSTNADISTEELKCQFSAFLRKFMNLIISADKENFQLNDQVIIQTEINVVNLKRFALYSSKSDYFRSEDEYSAEIILMPRKKIHF